ncbi:MAG TPA: OmpA family protein [Aurantimonas sp.]|uniref:OmpA family protein n=1 Tax=Aurantimonas marianensis TaxID=2920428 RepID=A0A9X2H4U5_9HYPH|nr:OmpA family protein [Aurantimonas marianensis]
MSAEIQEAPVPTGEISASDARVQQLSEPVAVPSITAEQGERIDAPATTSSQTTINDNSTTNNSTTTNNTTVNNTTVVQETRTDLPPGAEVVERVGDRDILSIVGAGVAGAVVGGAAAYFIRGNDDDRIAVDADERYYERLSGGRTRQTVVRPNGTQVVTITNRYGDVIQRSRILPDGREVVLFYDPYQDGAERPDYYYDPAADLEPVVLTIPEDQYIVDVAEPDEQLYYRTIVAPPVETVERIYSVDEVRRSERIRDKVRRIDLNTINFAFGSAAIEQGEVDDLQALADAIARVIKENPAETFLVEGHTDAVGSEIANLALSDRRAEAVASALSEYFDIPPENLITQGYGEQHLKVNTQAANAENRRVTLRRITALVKPVAPSAKR